MKIGIIGAGAMGSIFAYFFSKAGIGTVLFEKNAPVAAQMRSGLNVRDGGSMRHIDVEVSDRPGVLGECGIVFLFVKSYSTREAMREVAGKLDPRGTVVTLQNGIGNMEIIAEFIPGERIVYGSTIIGATKIDDNTVAYGGSVEVSIGGKRRDAVESVAEALRRSGLTVTTTPDPDKTVWSKAIINAGINPLGAILAVPNGMIIADEFSASIQDAIIREAVAVAAARGIPLDAGDMIAAARDVCVKTAANLCSMLQDIQARRRTEIDSISGSIIESGVRFGVPVPVNRTMFSLIRAKEMQYLDENKHQ